MPKTNDINCIILSAGKHKGKIKPCNLWSFSNEKSVLDWQIQSLEIALSKPNIKIAIGYKYKEILNRYKNLSFVIIQNWKKLNPLGSFLEVQLNIFSPLLLMYGDTVFHHDTIADFYDNEADVVVGVDSNWKSRFQFRSQKDQALAEKICVKEYGISEYTGLLKLSKKSINLIKKNYTFLRNKTFLELITFFENSKLEVKFHNIQNWAEMNEPNDLAKFILGTKGETLYRVKKLVTKSTICDQYLVLSKFWKLQKETELKKISNTFKNQRVIIRSSSLLEDDWHSSNAGAFLTIMNVDINNRHKLSNSIRKVFDSYNLNDDNSQVLIQPFIQDVLLSGVIITVDLVTGSPYYIISYDDTSGSTSSITSGKKGNHKTIVLSKKETYLISKLDSRLLALVEAAKEVEDIFGYNKMDIEFAIDKKFNLYLFQIRPITVAHTNYLYKDNELSNIIKNYQNKFLKSQIAKRNIFGNYTIFSNMTDWNPAEIIGKHPGPLAFSLYEKLITNQIWAKQRFEYGYKDLRNTKLMIEFAGQPYIDCRTSINSFMPKNLPDDTSKKIIITYLNLLKSNPHLHDKLELEVVFSIWEPDFFNKAKERFKNSGVNEKDIYLLEKELKNITLEAFNRLELDLLPLKKLKNETKKIVQSDISPLQKTISLIESCKKYGTLPFAHAARAGFVAITLMKSFVKNKAITKKTLSMFQSNIPTITSDFTNEISNKKITTDMLVAKYGHLRPGTYDITQLAYWENKNYYFNRKGYKNEKLDSKPKNVDFIFTKTEINKMQVLLKQLDKNIKVNDVIKFFVKAIQAREEAKFIFTKNLSLAMDEIVKYFSSATKIDRLQMSYLKWSDLVELNNKAITLKKLKSKINARKSIIQKKQLIKLPSIIISKNDFNAFAENQSVPNFITQKKIMAELITYEKISSNNLKGKIVIIPSADPGYDWLFPNMISGLITKFGGANSHMAIRCAELELPAAIGVGEDLYQNLASQKKIFLDCLNEKIDNV